MRTDGNLRIGWLRHVIAAAVATLAVAATLAAATPAQAYSRSDCPSGNVVDVDYLRVDTGSSSVDYGDGPHMWGSPQNNAVICWYSGRTQVVIRAKLFWDGGNETCAGLQYRLYDTSGTRLQKVDGGYSCDTWGSNADWWIDSNEGRDFDRIRIALYRTSSLPIDSHSTEVWYTNRYYGD